MYMKSWLVLLCGLILLLAGCSEKSESAPEIDDSYKRPPTLFLAVSDVLIEKIEAQNYTWQYVDKPTQHIEKASTDALPPSKTVSITKPVQIKSMRYLKIGFQPKPQYYRIILWDAYDRQQQTYTNTADIKEQGTYIMEVEANFETGKAHYYIPVTFPEK